MSVTIKSEAMTVQKCFNECLYSVPGFQRPFSWGTEQLDDYWDDVIEGDGDLFLGTTVTWVSSSEHLFRKTFSLIDGQQRLTTSSIALSVVRDYFQRIVDSSSEDCPVGASEKGRIAARAQVENTQKYLVAKNDDGDEYPVLERPEPLFWELIQQPDSIPSGKTANQSARLIMAARLYFERRVGEHLEGLDFENVIAELKSLRGQVLQANLIQVEVDSEENAFLIFETLNTRGAELRLSDLIKNMLVREISTKQRDKEAVVTRWQHITDIIASAPDQVQSLDRFIWQSWNSRRAAVKEAELYKSLVELTGRDSQKLLTYLEELECDAGVFRFLEGEHDGMPIPNKSGRSALDVQEFQNAIVALSVFNVSVANSAMLALARKYEQSRSIISQKQFKRAVMAIENFHFQFSALAKSGSTGGTRKRYNNFSVRLADASSKSEVTSEIDEFVSSLAGSLPSEDRVKESFRSLFYAPTKTLTRAQKKSGDGSLIRYVLLTTSVRLGQLPSGFRQGLATIEHISPQLKSTGSIDDPIYSIGNLALASEKANSKAGSGDFQSKRAMLQDCAAPRDATLLKWLSAEPAFEPGNKEIVERGNALAELAVNEIWNVR